MSSLRNPFGLRDGHIVMIEDISHDKNGLKCGCICPACKEPFEARMGEIRRHHFAHSGQGCDEVNAYLTGLYLLLQEYILEKHPLFIPPVFISYSYPDDCCLTENNIKNYISLLSKAATSKKQIQLSNGGSIIFNSAKIKKTANGRPDALLVTNGEQTIAIKVIPPDTICKTPIVTGDKRYLTIKMDLSAEGERIHTSRKSEIFEDLEKNNVRCQWIFDFECWIKNAKFEKAIAKIIRGSMDHLKSVSENRRKKEEERKERFAQQKMVHKTAENPAHTRPQMVLQSSELQAVNPQKGDEHESGYYEVKDRFTQQTQHIRDSRGVRWVKCQICGEIKPDGKFTIVGITEGRSTLVNLGKCKKCMGQR